MTSARHYICLSCGRGHAERALRRNGWGDLSCPICGSLRVERKIARGEVLRHFLIEYNRY